MKQLLQIVFILVLFISCDLKTNKYLAERKGRIEDTENNATQDQIDRKTKSIEYCKNYAIPAIEHLPYISSEKEVKIRPPEEIIERALALCYLGLKSEGLEKRHLEALDKKYRISDYFTEKEKLYVKGIQPTEQQKVDAKWRYESLHVLLWSLGYIDSLSYPDKTCNVAEDVKHIFNNTKDELIAKAKPRTKKEILDQADLIYRIHWACVNSRIKNQYPPGGLNPSVVYERHYALNWLINYMDQDWDDVSTDT